MQIHRCLILCLAISLVLGGAAAAQEGWQMPNLNPFAKKGRPPTSARVSDSSGSWKVPSLWSGKKKATAAKANQPSAWQKMTASSKKFWSATADTLNPFNDANDKSSEPISATGSNSYFSQAANSKPKPEKSNGILPAWFSGEEEDARPKGVNDFLRLPMPRP